MKRFLPLLALLVAPHYAFAQADANPSAPVTAPRFKATEDNLEAVALMGAFYNAIAHAQSYQGRFVFTRTRAEGVETVLLKRLDCKSAWTSQKAGRVERLRSASNLTQTVNGQTTVFDSLAVQDGEKRRRFSSKRNVWSQKPRDLNDGDLSQLLVQGAWAVTLLEFDQGVNFQVKEVSVEGQPLLVASETDGSFELSFDKATGYLRSWTIVNKNGEATQLRFLSLELNKPLAPETFMLDIPKSAKEVPPADMDVTVQF